MICKTFEIRDSGTFIPVLAIQLEPSCEADRYLLSRAGYGPTLEYQRKYVQLLRINGGGGESCCDPYEWLGSARTIPEAHKFIIQHFNELPSGAVIDVEFITGERAEPKKSEAESNYL